jgi:hypothetical protein
MGATVNLKARSLQALWLSPAGWLKGLLFTGPDQSQREEPQAPEKILTKQVQSDSNPDVFYTLTKDSSGWRCDCPGFRYRSQCKHSKAAVKEEQFIASAMGVPV